MGLHDELNKQRGGSTSDKILGWTAIFLVLGVIFLIAYSSINSNGGGGTSNQPQRSDDETPSQADIDSCVRKSTDDFERVYGPQTPAERQDVIDICSASDRDIADAIDGASP